MNYYIPLGIALGVLLLGNSKRKTGKMIRQEDIKKIKELGFEKHKLDFTKPTLVGIRGAQPDENGKLVWNGNPNNDWNDSLVVITKDNSTFFQGTVDAGNFYIKNPMNKLGTARLMDGLYTYKKGFHGESKYGSKYPAFVQASAVTIKRDGNKDSQWTEKDSIYKGFFGINIHAQFNGGLVERNSAGCTVLKAKWGTETWKQFYNLLKDEPTFKYMVIDGRELT